MQDNVIRMQMCLDYMKELDRFRPHPVGDDTKLRWLALELLERGENEYDWFDIEQQGKEVGFLMVNPSTPHADLMFEHCYVQPAYRRQGLSRRIHDIVVLDYGFLPGTYASVLFDRNAGEKAFLDHFIARHGGAYLSAPIDTRHPELRLYRYTLSY